MEEQGIVVELKANNTALVKAKRTSTCESCASKKSCSTRSSGDDMFVETENTIGASKGDHVVFAVSAGTIMKTGLLVYLMPVIAFLAGIVLGQKVVAPMLPNINSDLVSGALGLIFLIDAFVLLKIYNQYMEKKGGIMRPKLLRKL